MASVDAASLSKGEHDELCCSYAALLLHDDGLEITSEKLLKVIKASGNEVEPYWPGLFAKALQGQDIGALLTNIGNAGGSGGAAATGGDQPAEAVAEQKEEKKEEEEEVDVDMGGLFGGDDDDY